MAHSNRIAAWLAGLLNKRDVRELENLRTRMRDLELRVQHIQNADMPPRIVVEQIRIDTVVVDKIEYNNNFGALGIKELSGQLNIGANYTAAKSGAVQDGEGLFKENRSNVGQAQAGKQPGAPNFDGESLNKAKKDGGPKVNIKTKPSH